MNRSSSISRKIRPDPRAGFTLIEVLAALFVTGLFVVTALPFLTRVVGSAWKGEANMMTADEWMQASARMAADFGEAIPLSMRKGSKPRLAFRARPDRVEFVRRSLTEDRARLQIVTIRIEEDSEGESLVRSALTYSEDAFDASDSDAHSQEIALLKTPCHLRFKTDVDQGSGTSPDKLPVKVELDVDGCPALPDIPFVFPIVARTSPSVAIPASGLDSKLAAPFSRD